MIKLDIISGFLGAGKTTLIQKLFSEAFKKEKIVLIENEFGEIGVDSAFLKDYGINVREINSGCICCSLVGDFNKSLHEVIETYHPDRIIIEPSGVGKLSDIKKACAKHADDLVLNIVATVVDGGKAKIYSRNFGEFFIDQVSECNTLVVSKVDKTSEDKLNETLEILKSLNSNAVIITTSLKELDGVKLLNVLESKVNLLNTMSQDLKMQALEDDDDDEECDDPDCECHHHHHDEDEECECHHHHDEDEEECECHHHHHDEDEECECHHHDEDEEECECHHHHDEDEEECECHHHHDNEHHHHHHHHHGHDADEIFDSYGEETLKSYSYNELEDFLKYLQTGDCGEVLRSKGILKANDNEKWYYFDYVAGDYEIRLGEADYTGRLCVIGSKLDIDKIKARIK